MAHVISHERLSDIISNVMYESDTSDYSDNFECVDISGTTEVVYVDLDDSGEYISDQSHREQPIFTTKAHVFQIDPETKKNWLSLSDHAINVSFYHDSSRNSYRIISVEGSKALINSTITSGMTFTRTSHKFAQWSDTHANTVYGLGFETEPELTKFIEKFKEVKELSRTAKTDVNGSLTNEVNHTNSANVKLRTPSLSSGQSDSSIRERRNSYNSSTGSADHPPVGSSGHPSVSSTEAQLRYENDRLKLALAQSSANAKKWEVELQTLKNNNARLTTALQESTSNVEEWKKQLTAYKDESARLKKKVLDMEKNQMDEEMTTMLKNEVTSLTANLETSDQEIAAKDEELAHLNKRLSELMARDVLSKSIQSKAQSVEKENQSLTTRLRHCEKQLKDSAMLQQRTNDEITSLVTESGDYLTKSQHIHEQILSIIRGESDS